MRVAIAITSNATELFTGPFGHAPFFAVYEKRETGWQRIELRDNPYKALEGGGKGRLLGRLLADCDLWLGVKIDPDHEGEHYHSGRGVPRERLRQVDARSEIGRILASLEASP